MSGIGKFAAAAAAVALALSPTAASAATRALFVGINEYTFAWPRDPTAEKTFHSLKGAVADVALMKATLRARYGLDLDRGALNGAATCDRNAVSITLINACATRAAILEAFETQIAAAQAGDVVLFYYAGHGSAHEAANSDQVGGQNSTLVPVDAKRPPDEGHTDILDTELRTRIDMAAAKGVSVVTIFDSCNSGTATRDASENEQERTRAAPPVRSPAPKPQPPRIAVRPTAASVAAKAYQVHLAAASDTEAAHESSDGAHDGVFTLALTAALAELRRGATYRDIAAETRRKLEQSGAKPQVAVQQSGAKPAVKVRKALDQHTQAEGALDQTFLGVASAAPGRAYPGEIATPTEVRIEAGRLSGVTPGSSFMVFPNATAAARAERPLATGAVAEATTDRAVLRLSQPKPGLAGPVFVKELAHNFGEQRLLVRIDGGEAAERAAVTRELSALSYVQLVTEAAQFIVSLEHGQAEFRNADGALVVAAGQTGDVAFARRLAEVTRAAANYFALLGLRKDTDAQWGLIEFFRCQPVADCPVPQVGGEPAAKVGDALDIWVTNTRDPPKPLYRYVLFLSSADYQISVLSPADNSNDPPLEPGRNLLVYEGRLQREGRGTVLLLLTERPINVAALRQEPVRDIGQAAKNDLESLLLYAGAGQRGDAVVRTGDWSATLQSISVSK